MPPSAAMKVTTLISPSTSGSLRRTPPLGVALENVLGNGIAGLAGIAQAEHVGVEKTPSSARRRPDRQSRRHCRVLATERAPSTSGAALHVRQQLRGEFRRNFRTNDVSKNDLP